MTFKLNRLSLLTGMEVVGIHEGCFNSIMKSDIDLRKVRNKQDDFVSKQIVLEDERKKAKNMATFLRAGC